jgi:proteic killer suppression protein
MIESFAHKGLKELYTSGKSRRIRPDMIERCIEILVNLNVAAAPEAMNIHGFHFHGLQGNPKRWSVRVNKNYRVTFGWKDGPISVDLEDYH